MECPYCGAELIYENYYGTGRQEYYYGTAGNGIHYPSTFQKLGDIYKCPNHEGFETLEDVLEFIDGNEDDLEEYCNQHSIRGWEEVCCESSTHHVSGSFYTDKYGNLLEGYPC